MWATPQNVLDAWIGENPPTDTAKIQTWIDRAERIILQLPGIVEWIAADPRREAIVTDVVTSMVIRVFRNPEGYRTFNAQHTEGPFSANQSVTVGGDHPGELYLTDEERSRLGAVKARKAFTVMPRYR